MNKEKINYIGTIRNILVWATTPIVVFLDETCSWIVESVLGEGEIDPKKASPGIGRLYPISPIEIRKEEGCNK